MARARVIVAYIALPFVICWDGLKGCIHHVTRPSSAKARDKQQYHQLGVVRFEPRSKPLPVVVRTSFYDSGAWLHYVEGQGRQLEHYVKRLERYVQAQPAKTREAWKDALNLVMDSRFEKDVVAEGAEIHIELPPSQGAHVPKWEKRRVAWSEDKKVQQEVDECDHY